MRKSGKVFNNYFMTHSFCFAKSVRCAQVCACRGLRRADATRPTSTRVRAPYPVGTPTAAARVLASETHPFRVRLYWLRFFRARPQWAPARCSRAHN